MSIYGIGSAEPGPEAHAISDEQQFIAFSRHWGIIGCLHVTAHVTTFL